MEKFVFWATLAAGASEGLLKSLSRYPQWIWPVRAARMVWVVGGILNVICELYRTILSAEQAEVENFCVVEICNENLAVMGHSTFGYTPNLSPLVVYLERLLSI